MFARIFSDNLLINTDFDWQYEFFRIPISKIIQIMKLKYFLAHYSVLWYIDNYYGVFIYSLSYNPCNTMYLIGRKDMNKILVSVIIPAYNCANFISTALDSALIQDVPLEIIVINDASSDNLDQVMEKYTHLPQVLYLKNPQNLGVAESRNKGIWLARGKYIAFLDADDYWEKDKLKKQLKMIEKMHTVIGSTGRELMNPDGSLTGYVLKVDKEYTYKSIKRHNQINCSSVLILTDVAREFPMHGDNGHEDYLMWLEVLRNTHGAALSTNLC